jgi:hypothetical protein
MAWASGYRKKDPKRVCDICGVQMFFSELKYIGQNRWACSDDAPGLTEYQIARHNARVKPLLVRQVKHPRSLAQTPTYLTQEAQLFALVRDQWAFRNSVNGYGAGAASGTTQLAAQCGLYFGELLVEGERPTSWLTQAATQLRAIADFIISKQYGSPTGPNPAQATNTRLYGGVLESTTLQCTAYVNAISGLVLLRAYRLLGDSKYLVAANLVATFLRQGLQQRQPGVGQNQPTSVYLGGFCTSITTGDAPDTNFPLLGASAMWFLSELRAIVGGSTTYGVATAGGDFDGSAAGTLDAMLSEARAFYAGSKIPGFANPTGTAFGAMSMLSSATPRGNYFDNGSGSYSALLSSTGLYFVTSFDFSVALRGLYEYEGYSATVAGIYEWLMAFTSNPDAEPPAGSASFTVANGVKGIYNPGIALSFNLAYADGSGNPISRNLAGTTTSYDTTTVGILAPVRIASGRDLSDAKASLSAPGRIRASRTDTNDQFAYPLLRGQCGLSFQMVPSITGSAGQVWGVTSNAAFCGLVYRYAPRANPGVSTPS